MDRGKKPSAGRERPRSRVSERSLWRPTNSEEAIAKDSVSRHAARVAKEQRSYVVEIDVKNIKVLLSFQDGNGRLILSLGRCSCELSSRQAEELAEAIKEQAYNLRRAEG